MTGRASFLRRVEALEAAHAYYRGRAAEVADLEGAAKWAGRWKWTKTGEAFPLPDPAHVAPLEAHAARLWAGQEEAKTEEARRFFRYSAACCGLRAKLARVLIEKGDL